jgi:hypothetical protein
MTACIQPIPSLSGPAYILTAQVIRAAPGHVYRVRIEGHEEITAQLAMPLSFALKPGDKVLVAGQSPSSGYIIGLLTADTAQAIQTAEGAGARVQGQGPDQCIAVHDTDNRTVFEYYPTGGKAVIHAPEGDLLLDAPNGCINLHAGKQILCTSETDVIMHGRQAVRFAANGQDGNPDQALHLDADGARIGVHKMDITAGQGDISIARLDYRGKHLTSSVNRAKLVFGKLETTAQRIWQNSEYLFRQVQHLCQMQAGRMRTLVRGAHHTQSQRTTLIAREDVRIDGQKINLG